MTQNNQNPVMLIRRPVEKVIYEECKHHAGFVDIFFRIKDRKDDLLYYCDYKKETYGDKIKQWETEHPFEVEKN